MSTRDRASLQQILAVTLAVVMLVSMGGVAFVGGAGAQTGGTADGLLDDETSVASDLGIDSGDGVLTTGDATIDPDGSVTVDEESGTQFSGLTVTPDRIGVANDNLATGLNNAVTEVDVEGTATPVVVIEYAPQSNFSQIDDVEGTHDFIVIGNDTALPDDITGGTTSNNIVAYSVDNDNIGGGNTTELANKSSFDSTIDTIVGSSESDLQNDNVDDFRIGAGTFEETPNSNTVTVNALQISSDAVTGETIHSELIALDDGTEQRFFNSVTNASAEAGDGDTITVGTGGFTDLESDPIVLSNNELTVSGGGPNTNLNTNVDITGNNVTVEGFNINDADTGGNGIVNVTGANPTIQQLEIDQGADGDTGISITSGASSAVTTVDDVRVTANTPGNVSTGDTGLALDTNAGEDVAVTNSTFEGHETQIAGNANVDEGTFLSNFENTGAESAVARNASGAVIGNAIYGSINRADAENPVDGSIEVSQGDYTHANVVNITTNNVSVTATGSAEVNNDLEISGSAGDVTVTGFGVNAASTTAATDLSSLTFENTNADTFDVGTTAGSVTNATFTSTNTGSGAYDVTAGDTVAVDDADGGDFTLNGSSAVDVLNADGDSFTLDSTGDVRVNQTESAGTVEIGSGASTPADVTITDGDANNYNIADVAGDVTVTGSATTGGGIDVASSAADVRINNADVTLDDDSEIGVNVTASGADNEVISINNTDVDGGSADATGINVTDVDASATADYTIENNDLTNFADGIGVNIAEQPSTGREANISISDNAIAGGSNFIGIQANLSAAEDVAIVGNEIVGADVSGGADSVGIKFVEAPDFGGGFLGGGTGAEFNNNTITGHARLIEDRSSGSAPPIRSEGYTRIINELDNDFGTLVIGENGDFEATYGDDLEINDGTGGVVYLPGSIDQAVTLVGDSPNVESAELQVYEPSVTVSSAISSTPDKYDDDPVVFPDADDITVTGESEDVEAETTFEITGGDARNNHDIRSLTIDSDGTAISVSTTKAQSEFTDLDVTATDTGLDVDPNGTDVNVIEVRRSSFDVGADGIDFAGTPDDRDGFVVDTVTIEGDGISAGGTGLDLSGVEKPGKAGLPVNLTVTGATVTDFSTQVAVGDDIPADADDFLNNKTTASVTIQDNEFEQAIRVVDDNDDLTDDDLYGSVNTADDAASDGDTIDVLDVTSAATRYNHGLEVTLATPNVTLSGPVAADAGVTTDAVVIEDPIRATNTAATVEDLVVDTDASSTVLNETKYGANADAGETAETIVGANADVNLTVQDATITTTLGSTYEGERPVGIGAASDGSTATLEIDSVSVGGSGSGIGTGVVAQENVKLIFGSSELLAGANGVDANGNLVSEGYGVLAGPGTSPTISTTEIDGFDADGINTIADSFQMNAGAVTNNNAASADSGVGGVATNADIGSPANEYIFTGTNISANDGVGVTLTGVGLDADGVTVSDNTDTGVDVTGDDVEIDEDSTIADNGATGVVLEVTDATVANSNLSANGAGADIEATNATVETTELSNNDGDGVVVDAETATITDNTVQQNADGVAVDLVDGANSTVTLNNMSGNAVGLNIIAGADELTVTGNAFDSTTTAIDNNDDATLDGTLNFFGTETGPVGGAGVTDNVVYDPFLTTDQSDSTVAAITETTEFGHDAVLQPNEFTSVGIPAEAAGDGDFDLEEHLTIEDGNVFVFNRSTERFERVQADDFNAAEELSPLEAIVVENQESQAGAALIDYTDETDPAQVYQNTYEFQEGLNFVAPQQTGTVDEALFPGGDTDFVAQPFSSGGNLYGATDADQVRDQFVEPSADGFSDNFRSGAGDRVVHPHVGYLVTVNEESNEGLQVSERISFPNAPTAANIAERTDGDDTAATNLNSGEEYENLQIAFAEADNGDRIRLGTGVLEVDPNGISDELVIDNSNLTVFGAGDGATILEGGNVTVTGDDNVLTDFQIRGANLNTDGNNNDVSGVSVTSASPGGDVVVDGDNNAFSDVNVESLTITSNADSTDVNRAVVGTFDDSGTGTTTTDVSQARVVVDDATELREAANGTTSFVNSETTIVVDETIDLGGTTADVTVDGVTIRGAGTVENASTLFNVTASDVTLEDVTLNASANTGVNLDLSAGDSVTISDTTLSVTSGTALDASDTDASIDATIEENAFEADSDDNARYVTDENDVLDLAAIQDDNEFSANVVLVEGNSDYALTPTIQGGVNAAENTDGDTVSVSAGTYDESVTVDVEGLTLESADGAEPTINAGDTRNEIRADDVTFDGFSVVFESQGIYVTNGNDNVTIQNSEFTLPDGVESTGDGIRYEGQTSDGEIRNNVFTGISTSAPGEFGNGIVLAGPDGFEVVGNTFEDNSIGVNVGNNQNPDGLIIQDNTFTGQDDFAVALNHDDSKSPNITVSSNDFDSNPTGVLVLSGGDIDISSNAFTGDSSTVYVDDQVGVLTLDDVLNTQGNTFDPDGEVDDANDQIVPEGQQQAQPA